MKYVPETQDVDLPEDIEEYGFTIESSPIAFEILSGNIYKDRILAIPRELACNAYDSHCDAIDPNTQKDKSDIPFKIKLPNHLDPTFVIRDFGVGLSPLMVKKLYTRYFKSTKTESNKYVGFMGLGSKSPFAYTESFTVNSYWNGKKYNFCAYKNEFKKPCISELGSSDTDEENGLEIIIPVDRFDFSEFRIKTENALTFFKVQPIVTGNPDFRIKERNYLFKNEKFAILKGSSSDNSHVVMGNVGYELSVYDLGEDIQPIHKKIIRWGIDVFVNIGDVTPAASREQITWTKDARQNIINILDEVVVTMQKHLQSQVNSLQTIWECRLFFHELSSSFYHNCCDISSINWNGKNVTDCVFAISAEDVPDENQEKIYEVVRPYKRRRGYLNSDKKYELSKLNPMKIIAKNNAFYYINDLEENGEKRIANGKKRILRHFYENNTDGTKSGYLIENFSQQRIDEIGFEHLLIKSSTLPEPPVVERQKSSYVKTKRTVLQVYSKFGKLSDAQVDINQGGIYIHTKYNKFKLTPTKETFDEYRFLDKFLYKINCFGINPVVYGIRPFESKIIQNNPKWVNLFDYAKAEFLKLTSKAEEIVKHYTNLDFVSIVYDLEKLLKSNIKINKTSDFYRLIQFNEEINIPEPGFIYEFIELNDTFGNVFNLDPKDTSWVSEILEKYPLINPSNDFKNIQPYVQYINMIDGQNKLVAV